MDCRNNIRNENKDCYCEIDSHYIGYTECFAHWCKHWSEEKEK